MDFEAFNQWADRHDPQRPAFPYHDKPCLDIRRHIPPEPYGGGYVWGTGPKMAEREEIANFTVSEWCLGHPVADTPPHPDQTVHHLHVIDEIACEDGRGTQLLRCYLNDDKDHTYVAKIYDPLYYGFADTFSGLPVDVTWAADYHYSREAAAYEKLKEDGVGGVFTPKYHGSWTFNMPFADAARPVRLILMEWIQGVSLYSLLKNKEVLRITPQQRLEIFARALEAECKSFYHHVCHGDFDPRNVIVAGLNIKARAFQKVLLVGFNESIVTTRPNAEGSETHSYTKPPCPRYRYWETCPNEFFYWVPQPHREQEEVFKGWLKTRWEELGEFDGPSEDLKSVYDFDEPVEMAEPEQDTQVPELLFLD